MTFPEVNSQFQMGWVSITGSPALNKEGWRENNIYTA